MQRKSCIIFFAALSTLPALAGDDFGLWAEIGIQKDFSKKISIDAALEFRAADKVSQPSRWAVSVGASYKPIKYFSLGAGYVFIHDYSPKEIKTDYEEDDDTGILKHNGYNVNHGYWRNKHRATIDLTGKLPIGRFTLSLRERYQFTHFVSASVSRTRYRSPIQASMIETGGYSGDYFEFNGDYFGKEYVVEIAKEAKNRHYLRSRLQLEYNIPHCAWTPYVSCETSNNLCESLHLDKTRYSLGVEWKISKRHRLDFTYLYEDGADDDALSDSHVLSFGYKFKF